MKKASWVVAAGLWGAVLGPCAMGQGGAAAQSGGGAMAAAQGSQVPPAKVYGDLLRSMSSEIIGAAEAMPEDKYSFTPPASDGNFGGVRSFGDEVKHLTSANYGFFKAFGSGSTPDMAKLKSMNSKAEIVQGLKDSYAYANNAVASITAANAFTPLQMGTHSGTRAGMTTFALAHAMDHYGQMVEYLRMNGITPPASVKK